MGYAERNIVVTVFHSACGKVRYRTNFSTSQTVDSARLLAFCTTKMQNFKFFIFNLWTLKPHFSGLISSVSFCLVFPLLISSCIQRQRQTFLTNEAQQSSKNPALNLNIATKEDLEKLPGIGEELAGRIIEYRKNNGFFRRPEELILVRGISEKKFRSLHEFVKTN
jgi:competence ComEA-like helix-hairpin-helix protein